MASRTAAQVHKQYGFCDKCRPGGHYAGCMRCALLEAQALFAQLDEALATPEEIARDTAAVGGYVSGLDLTYGAKDVVERAIARLKSSVTGTK